MYLSCSILIQLLYNLKSINRLELNYPILDKELFIQNFFTYFCLLILYCNLKIEGFFSNLILQNDGGTILVKIFFVSVCLMVYPAIYQFFKIQILSFFEFFVVFSLSVLSMLFIICSSDFITFYIVLEMQALCFYILASFKKNSSFSTEAGLKYFISGSFISGFFLLGISIVYFCLGTLNIKYIQLLLMAPINTFSSDLNFFLLVGFILVIIVLFFKMSCAPFHFWSPDVYDGAPFSSLIIFSVFSKISILVFLVRFIISTNLFFFYLENLFFVCGLISCLIGTIFALNQKRLKKLFIYSSIAQVGFIVSGVGVATTNAYVSVYFFLFVYIITSILIWNYFFVFHYFQFRINRFYNRFPTSLYITDLASIFKKNKLWSFSFMILFFSIAGMPPFGGFLSKLFIILQLLIDSDFFISKLLVLISCVSVFYYIRVLKVIYFESIKVLGYRNNFQVFLFDLLLNYIYVLYAIILFLLIYLFFGFNFFVCLFEYLVLSI